MNCDIDFCQKPSDCTLTVVNPEQTIKLVFCASHANDLEARLASQLGMMRHQVNLRKGVLSGVMGDLQEALDYLDTQAANKSEGKQ